jgi:hypothetical protein
VLEHDHESVHMAPYQSSTSKWTILVNNPSIYSFKDFRHIFTSHLALTSHTLSLSLSRESQLGITLPFKKCHSFNNLCNRRRGASFNNKLNSPRRDSLHTHFLLLLCTPFPHTPSLISYPSSVMLNFSLVHPHHFTESPVPKVNSYQYGKSQTGKVWK